MSRFAFMDTGSGYYQGAETAETLDDAIRAYASRVKLLDEAGLDLRVAEIDAAQEAVLDAHFDFRGMTEAEEATAATIAWRLISDENVRDILGLDENDA